MDDLLALTDRAHAGHFWFHGFRRFVARALADVAAERRDLRAVDCGCGTGQNMALLEPYGRTFGFDLTLFGSRRASDDGRSGRVVCADITAIPLSTGSVDIAASFDVLQCVPDDRRAMREMARIIKPGGHVVLTLAALDWLRGDHAIVWNEVRRYTPNRARTLIEQAGLEVRQISFMFATLLPLMFAARLTQRVLRPFRGVRADTDITVPPALINTPLTWLVSAEAALAARLPMPIGSSLLVVARKKI